MTCFTRWILAATTLALSPALALAQATAFPAKPLKILVPFTAGSGADSSSRFYGEHLGKIFNQAVNVENRPGGSGVVAVQATRQAPADGHVLMLQSGGWNEQALVEDAELGSEVPVRLGIELEHSRLAATAHFVVVVCALADRHAADRRLRPRRGLPQGGPRSARA